MIGQLQVALPFRKKRITCPHVKVAISAMAVNGDRYRYGINQRIIVAIRLRESKYQLKGVKVVNDRFHPVVRCREKNRAPQRWIRSNRLIEKGPKYLGESSRQQWIL